MEDNIFGLALIFCLMLVVCYVTLTPIQKSITHSNGVTILHYGNDDYFSIDEVHWYDKNGIEQNGWARHTYTYIKDKQNGLDVVRQSGIVEVDSNE